MTKKCVRKNSLISLNIKLIITQTCYRIFSRTSPCLDGLSLIVGGLHIRAVPLMTTATSPTKTPSGCLSSDGNSMTSSPIRLNASTKSSCSFRAFSMFITCPLRSGKEEVSTKLFEILETMAKLNLKQSEPITPVRAIATLRCQNTIAYALLAIHCCGVA